MLSLLSRVPTPLALVIALMLGSAVCVGLMEVPH